MVCPHKPRALNPEVCCRESQLWDLDDERKGGWERAGSPISWPPSPFVLIPKCDWDQSVSDTPVISSLGSGSSRLVPPQAPPSGLGQAPVLGQNNHLGLTSRLRYSTFLDPSNVIFLHWDFDLEAEIITFELQVQTAGWVGLGITSRYTRVGSNLVVGGVSPDGNVYFSNQHLVDEDALEEDGSQDAELQALTEDAVYTTMRFSRPFRSCDPQDQDVTSDTVRVLAAYGPDDTLKLDWECTSVKSIFLLQIVHPDVPEDTIIHDLEITDFLIPEDDTTYACTFFPLSIVSKKHHIYKFEPKLIHHKETMVHHILVYACGNASVLPKGISDCYGADPASSLCSQIIVGWAVGGTSYQFPGDGGISTGMPLDPQWVRLEIHYSNLHSLPGEHLEHLRESGGEAG
ncbi:putative DBH-like monooxygenase protein 2 [Mesoplodon densirostris]|uniref:putative DBH-like monooxygenase protein 2 n=1 Tax=Mesoplodon densirostris TaxID=48708 RepID=UPI0028DBD8A9|nr:putative DBH-like monooxygenase protein 2 [Mesoplodon densirostris]